MPSVLWAMHLDEKRYPKVYLLTTEDRRCLMRIQGWHGYDSIYSVLFSRAELRTLVRRINQFLDDTK